MKDTVPPTDPRTQKERMLAGDPELAEDSLRAVTLPENFNESPVADAWKRRSILEDLLGTFGEEAEIQPPFYCDYGYQLHIRA